MSVLEILSPAKVNLTLEVLKRRPDGYHDIDSIVQTVSIFDRIVLKKNNGRDINFSCSSIDIPTGNDNLVVKAARSLFDYTGINCGVDIRLEKTIPVQAGLGGGSSNAASVIAGLNTLLDIGLSKEEQSAVGAKTGSDVPLFIYGGTVHMTGRGEIIDSLPDNIILSYLVIKPDESVSTAWAYAELDKREEIESVPIGNAAEQFVESGDFVKLVEVLHNDFQCVVSNICSGVSTAIETLKSAGADKVLLAGSGSAVVGIFLQRDKRNNVYKTLSKNNMNVWMCESLSRQDCAGLMKWIGA